MQMNATLNSFAKHAGTALLEIKASTSQSNDLASRVAALEQGTTEEDTTIKRAYSMPNMFQS
jgi:hypothetical protein